MNKSRQSSVTRLGQGPCPSQGAPIMLRLLGHEKGCLSERSRQVSWLSSEVRSQKSEVRWVVV